MTNARDFSTADRRRAAVGAGLFALLIGFGGLARPARADKCLDQYIAKLDVDALQAKATNDLTHAQARDLILYLVQQEQISLPSGNGWTPLFNGACEIIPGPLKFPSTANRISIVNKVGDARFFMYANNQPPTRQGKPFAPARLDNLQPRLVVGLHRLVALLNGPEQNLRVYEIYTNGIANVDQGDHKAGVAFDLAGVKGERVDTRDTQLFVLDDWGNQPVRKEDRDDAVTGHWKRSVTKTEYRLNANGASAPARDFFRLVHDFFAREFAGCPGNAIENKCPTDRLKHPDYPISSTGTYGREGHANHIHAGMRP